MNIVLHFFCRNTPKGKINTLSKVGMYASKARNVSNASKTITFIKCLFSGSVIFCLLL